MISRGRRDGPLSVPLLEGMQGTQESSSNVCPHGKVRCLDPCIRCWHRLMRESYKITVHYEDDKKLLSSLSKDCEHNKKRKFCFTCRGSQVCSHGKLKIYCVLCDGRRVCTECRERTTRFVHSKCAHCENGGVLKRRRKKKGVDGEEDAESEPEIEDERGKSDAVNIAL